MLSPRGKKELKINQRRILINSIEIGIPAPEQVFILGQRHTSNGKMVGRVRNSKTLNYKSFTPHRDGLFCERIFGPVQSYICACGKQGPLTTSKGILKFCPRCEVEYTDQRARRYRVGYIGLVSPVTHIWHLKGRPSYLSLFLGKRKKTLATLAYCNDYLVEQAFSKVAVNDALSSAKQRRAELSHAPLRGANFRPTGRLAKVSESYGAKFFKNRILKGLKESKVIKGFTLSREQEKSKVWSSDADFIDRHSATRASLELREVDVEKFDKPNRKCTNFLKHLRLPKRSTVLLPPSLAQGKREFSKKRDTLSYTRSQTLPFLPSFICEFHLRDGLLSFFDTFPPSEDIPIPIYCKIPRRYPLRDVHKFMADQAFSKVQISQSSTKGFDSQNMLMRDQNQSRVTPTRPASAPFTEQPEQGAVKFTPSGRSELLLGPKGLEVEVRAGANASGRQIKNKSSLSTASLNYKMRVIGDSDQLSLPKREVGLRNRKDVSHTSIGTVNDKNFLSSCAERRLSTTNPNSGPVLREVLLSLLLDRVVTTLIGLTPSLATCLNRPKSPMAKSKVLIGAKPTVVMARRVGNKMTVPAADETETFEPPYYSNSSYAKTRSATQSKAEPNKSKGLVLANHVVLARKASTTSQRTSNWPKRGLKEISNYRKVKRLNDILRVKRFPLVKPTTLVSQSRLSLHAPLRGASNQSSRRLAPRVTARDSATESKKLNTNYSEAIVRPASTEAEYNSRSVFFNQRNRVSTQTKSFYSKSKIASEDLQLKHASGFWLPVIEKSPAHLTIRLVFAQGWSSLGSLTKAWLANPYRSSSGYRLATDAGTADQDRMLREAEQVPLFENRKYVRALPLEADEQRDRIDEPANPRLEHTSKQGYFEDSFFSLRSWVRQRRTITGALRFGESVEDWLEYWFDRWLQDRYGVKRTLSKAEQRPTIFNRSRLYGPVLGFEGSKQELRALSLTLARRPVGLKFAPRSGASNQSKSATETDSAKSSGGNSSYARVTPSQKGEQLLVKESNPAFLSRGRHLCTLRGPLFLLALRSYALGLTDRPGDTTYFFSYYQITSIEIQRFLQLDTLLRRTRAPLLLKKKDEPSQPERDFDQNTIFLKNFTGKLSGSEPRSKDPKDQTLPRKVTKSNEDKLRNVGPKHNIACYLSKHQKRVNWIKRGVFSSDRDQSREVNCPDLSAQPASSESELWPVRPSVLVNSSALLPLLAPRSGASRQSKSSANYSLDGVMTSYDTQSEDALQTSKNKKGPKSILNIDSKVWFPKLVTIFKIIGPKKGTFVDSQLNAGTRFRLTVLSRRLSKKGPKEAQKQSPNNKNLIFTGSHNTKKYLIDPTIFSDSYAPTSKSVEESISIEGTVPERTSDWLQRGYLKNEVGALPRRAPTSLLTKPRFVIAGSSWGRRALEKYRDTELGASLTQMQQLNKSASGNSTPPAAGFARVIKGGTETPFQRSVFLQPPLELPNQTQDGQTRSDVFFSNGDEYGDEEGNVSLLDDEPEINRVGSGLLGSSGNIFRTDSYSDQLSKEQPRRAEHNATSTETGKVGTDSYMKAQLDLQAIQEVLSYTGGGALRELLRCFDTQAFSVILLNEIKLLREYHKGYFLYEYDRVSRKTQTRATLELSPLSLSQAEHASSAPLKAERDFVTATWSSKTKEIEINNNPPFWSTGTSFRQAEYDNNYEELPEEINRFSRAIHRNARRLKIVQLLMRNKRRPEWMLISALPVLPPDLRPILQMSENLIVASDLNTLYQRVIYRNNRQYKLRIVEWSYATSLQRLVQDAVDRLIENGKGGSKPFLTPGGRPLKSLSDTLKGKKGRFRLNLLGKRVDFSGRSVIVVSPHLKIHECGLPREMALELYQYLLIRQMLLKRQVSSVILAKKVIRQQKAFVWDTLRELIYHHPLLLNRAPTLHRLGIQAFQPKLVLGSTILLHPLVCAGFNADFDGDQMGVHLPLCDEARAEAWDLLWSRNNLLSPATGEPILLPSQDMVLGFYHMTALLPSRHANPTTQTGAPNLGLIIRSADKTNRRRSSGFVQIAAGSAELSTPTQVRATLFFEKGLRKSHFFSPLDVVRAYQNGDLDIHTPIWLQWKGKIENNNSDQIPLELRINSFGVTTQLYPSYKYRKDTSYKSTATFNLFIRTTSGRVIVNNIFLAPTDRPVTLAELEFGPMLPNVR